MLDYAGESQCTKVGCNGILGILFLIMNTLPDHENGLGIHSQAGENQCTKVGCNRILGVLLSPRDAIGVCTADS